MANGEYSEIIVGLGGIVILRVNKESWRIEHTFFTSDLKYCPSKYVVSDHNFYKFIHALRINLEKFLELKTALPLKQDLPLKDEMGIEIYLGQREGVRLDYLDSMEIATQRQLQTVINIYTHIKEKAEKVQVLLKQI